MNEQLNEQQLQRLSRHYLNDLVENLDKSTAIRLQNARYQALQGKSANSYPSQWLAAFATVILIMGVFWQIDRHKTNTTDDFLLIEDIIQAEENQDLLNELDFYQWLESQSKQGKLV